MANKTITDFTETSTLSAGDYAVIQNSTDGYQSFDLGTKLAEVDSDITQINSDLSASTTTYSTDYGLTLYVRSNGKNVCIKFTGTPTTQDTNTWIDLCTLDSSLIPPFSIAEIYQMTNGNRVQFVITTEGVARYQLINSTTVNAINAMMCYVL